MRLKFSIEWLFAFASGYTLGHHAGGTPWRTGFAMIAIGVALVVATSALGG